MAPFLFILISILSVATVSGSEKHFKGYFNVGKKPYIVNRENLTRALQKSGKNRNKRIRVLLLVNSSFRQSSLSEIKCRFLSRRFDIVTAECPESVVPYLTALDGVLYVKRPERIYPNMDSTRKQVHVDEVHGTRPSNLPEHFTGKNVLVGIMETEFDTRHPAFLDSSGLTRFTAIWNQSDTSEPSNSPFGYGVIKNRNELIKDTLFAQEGHPHGTYVTSIAVGSDRTNDFYGVAPDALIAGVKYGDTDIDLINGLEWLFSLADSLKLPCVINVSIGAAAGPHDGTSLFDRALDSISGPGKIVVGAVGNDGNKASHLMLNLSANEVRSTWITPKLYTDTDYYSGIDLWGEPGQTFSISLYIIDVSDMKYIQSATSFSTTGSMHYQPDNIIWTDSLTGSTDTIRIQIGVERSNPLNKKPHAIAACFTKNPSLFIGVEITAGKNGGVIHAWNNAKLPLRSFGMTGFQDGDTLYNVNEIGGTANRIITAGGYVGRTSLTIWDGSVAIREEPLGGLTYFSGSGPTVDGRVKPDILGPGWLVVGAMSRTGEDDGLIAIWPDPVLNTGRYWASMGTSISAPVVAGVVALMLQADSSLTPETARQYIQETAITDDMTGPLISPENKWGAGKINALGAIQKILGVTGITRSRHLSIKPEFTLIKYGGLLKVNSRKVKYLALIDIRGRRCMISEVSSDGMVKIPDIASGIYTAVMYGEAGTMVFKDKLLLRR